MGESHMTAPGGQTLRQLGPGLSAALSVLGPAGRRIEKMWTALDATGLAEMERSLGESAWPAAGPGVYDETRFGTHWRAYGRHGVASALLRRASARNGASSSDRSD